MRNKTTALEVAASATAVPRRTVSPAGRALVIAASMILFALTGCAAGAEVEKPSTTSAYLEQIAESWAEYYAIADPPTVDPVRFIGTEEADTVHRECLLGAGYARDGMGLIAVPEGQEAAFALAEYTCRMQYPVSEEFAQEWGNDQVRSQYAWTRDFVMPCLEAAGYTTAGLPSESVFIETWYTDPFFPFAQVQINVPPENFNTAWAALEAQCPQIAPADVAWGGVSVEDWVAQSGR